MDKSLLSCYKHSLFMFTYYVGMAQRMSEKEGDYPKDEQVALLSHISFWKEKLLQYKKQAGFNDGLSFLSDNRFLGFEIKNGRFIGDEEKVYPILEKWLFGFPDRANNYQYEVSMYIMNIVYEADPEDVFGGLPSDEAYEAAA